MLHGFATFWRFLSRNIFQPFKKKIVTKIEISQKLNFQPKILRFG